MQREKMVGWWGSSGEAQQLPLLPSHRLIQKICSPQHHKAGRGSGAFPFVNGICGELGKLEHQHQGRLGSRLGGCSRKGLKSGCKRCQEGFGARISFKPNKRTWKPFPTWSSSQHGIYVPAPAPTMGGLTSPLFLSLESSEPLRPWPSCDELGVSVMNRQTNRATTYPARYVRSPASVRSRARAVQAAPCLGRFASALGLVSVSRWPWQVLRRPPVDQHFRLNNET